jgi:hypothetical protein
MPLVPLDEPATSLPPIAIVSLDHGAARFGDTTASAGDRRAMDDVMERVNKSSLSPGFGSGRHGGWSYTQPLVLFVSAEEPWSDVTMVLEAAARHGFTTAYLPFSVKSKATPPGASPAAKRILEISVDQALMPWQRDDAAANALAQANPACPRVAQPFAAESHDSTMSAAQLTAFMDHAADEALGCGCNVDIEAIKALAWTRFGRQWGPPTVSYQLQIAPSTPVNKGQSQPPQELSGAASSTWREMSPQVMDAARQKVRVRVTAR